jgi:hypothetical protein
MMKTTVVVKTKRKPGRTRTGKVAELTYFDQGAGELVTKSFTGNTFKDISRQLRATGRVPTHVTLNKMGKTEF